MMNWYSSSAKTCCWTFLIFCSINRYVEYFLTIGCSANRADCFSINDRASNDSKASNRFWADTEDDICPRNSENETEWRFKTSQLITSFSVPDKRLICCSTKLKISPKITVS